MKNKKIPCLPKNRVTLFINGQWLKDSNGVLLVNKRHRMKRKCITSNFRKVPGNISAKETCSGCGNCKKS